MIENFDKKIKFLNQMEEVMEEKRWLRKRMKSEKEQLEQYFEVGWFTEEIIKQKWAEKLVIFKRANNILTIRWERLLKQL